MVKTKACVFCGTTPTNIEDIWPKWIGRYLGPQRTYTQLKTSSGIESVYKSMAYNARAKVVCQKLCNGGWMKALEDANNPLLKRMFDESFSIRLLAGDTMRSLAQWIFKTALMIQYIQTQSAIPAVVYDEFFGSGQTVPDHCWIYLAHHTMGEMPSGSHSVAWEVGASPDLRPGVPYHGQMYGVTFFVKNLVMQVVAYRLDVPSKLSLDMRFPQRFRPFVQEIWPMGWGIEWPPSKPSFTDEGLRDFALGLAEIHGSMQHPPS